MSATGKPVTGSRFEEPDARGREIIKRLGIGRANAISVKTLAARVSAGLKGPSLFGEWAVSTVRADITRLQDLGVAVLTSPRAGVWLAADDDETLDVLEEMRASIAAIQKRMQAINQGCCALRSCRAPLPTLVARRGGLYCNPEHRYKAAVERDARAQSHSVKGKR